MPKLPKYNARELISLAEKNGFVFTRQTGSHKIFRNAQGIRLTIPVHDSKIIHPKLIKQVLIDLGLLKK
ncbi:MAG: hypothetical protein COV07_03090 [Candidatus Vogelbacteria bacterium CG10_big_fil_rev_8_21_14_0_10_45_14]|uniref:Type II toxin-antitoxin system HicA family toxin n=1 Tax=Candidatus Vogelbacteria bacterium CG10_big_fil_rev_8_21_14_0_10_45_14 TaxID=1975042 RepID=A0A2H0RJF9_9BACT|nr:MAG: hypothetical protein COV07_03090 [Candidatus Vogelbacteria bacterium CG10_big_fil_rev_8_21_14_0_10_45_14]